VTALSPDSQTSIKGLAAYDGGGRLEEWTFRKSPMLGSDGIVTAFHAVGWSAVAGMFFVKAVVGVRQH
jgi:hypothetical protein